ncbi:glia maturation factor beta-like [Lineus longissimus]|uniref:glia maturation factor beta-like n=1 Tax=Lineus longissimus TaxID=88925 RepID=UPI002B4D8081
MAQNLVICGVSAEVTERIKKLKISKSKTNNAVVLKVDLESRQIVLDEEYEDTSIEELQNELPSHRPSYVFLSYEYKHDDGRISYPFIFIFISPSGCKPEMQMMYSGSKLNLVKETEVSKVFEIRSTEDLTEEWLLEKLKFFR